jgi:argininosuccinate lyase
MIRKGRFNKPAAEICESLSFDWRLFRYDIAGSIRCAVTREHRESDRALALASGAHT